jgi:hypothetical protein
MHSSLHATARENCVPMVTVAIPAHTATAPQVDIRRAHAIISIHWLRGFTALIVVVLHLDLALLVVAGAFSLFPFDWMHAIAALPLILTLSPTRGRSHAGSSADGAGGRRRWGRLVRGLRFFAPTISMRPLSFSPLVPHVARAAGCVRRKPISWAYKTRSGAVPVWDRGPGQTAPTYIM